MSKKKNPKNELGCPEVRRFKLNELRPAEYNPREISNDALAGLAASLEKFGCVEPIVVNIRDDRNTIIGGNQRFKVLSAAGVKECICIAVDLDTADEKLLNITLNNPHSQGKFIEALDDYLDALLIEIRDNKKFLDLQIDKLHREVGRNTDDCKYSEENLRPYKKTHILLSFLPALLPEIAEHLKAIIQIEGVEYEQGSN